MDRYNTDDMIFALATAPGRGALAVFRISGAGCIAAFAPCFSNREKLLAAASGTLVYGEIKDIDQVLVSVFRSGHGYTGEEALEISCHGSTGSVTLMTRLLLESGFRQALPGEFTLRAFLNGRIDLTQAEAVDEIARSGTALTQKQALSRLDGAMTRRIGADRDLLAEAMAAIEVQLDYAEDEIGGDTSFPYEPIEKCRADLDCLAGTFGAGRILSEGASVVLAGPANAGKSSLFNLFLKQERSIVSPVPGTTRDYIECLCSVEGIPVRLCDTAGLRQAGEEIEMEGIRRTGQLMAAADVIVYLLDASETSVSEALRQKERAEADYPAVEKVFVWNKTDLSDTPAPEGFIGLSVATAEGFAGLSHTLALMLQAGVDVNAQTVVQSPRQHQALVLCVQALDRALEMARDGVGLDAIAVELKEASDQLGFICGELTGDDILEQIFSRFCVGK